MGVQGYPSRFMGRSKTFETWGTTSFLVVLGGLLLAWSWGRWLDPMVDFGRELYVPWRLTEGEVLFSDISYVNGPFSPYFNAMAFALFGVALRTLVWLNVFVLAVTALLVHRLIRPVFGGVAALVSVATILGVFAFCQLTKTANYNFIAPYSHEMTHGLALSFGMLACLESHFRARRTWMLAAAGFLLGLVFLTKAEFFVAAALAAAVRTLLDARLSGRLGRSAVVTFGVIVGGGLVPVAAAWLLLGAASTWRVGTEGILGAWPYLLGTDVSNLRFFRQGMGWDDPDGNVRRMALSAAGWCATVGVSAAASLALRGKRPLGHVLGATASVAIVAAAAIVTKFPWSEVGRPLPLVLLAATAWYIARAWRAEIPRDERARSAAAGALAVFSLALLAKMILNARLYHYGFALAMPGGVFVAAFLTGEVPRWLTKRGGHAAFYRTVAVAWIAALAILHLRVTDKWFDTKTIPVGREADSFLTGPGGETLNRIDDTVREHALPGDTLAVVPEGIMVNFLQRRKNPTGFHTFLPPEFAMLGESRFLEGFRRAPPDWVVIVHRDVREFGVIGIGEDFGRDLMAWIANHYVAEAEIAIPDAPQGRAFLGRYEPGS